MRRWTLGGALLTTLSALVLVAGCGSSGSTSGSSGSSSSGGSATAGLTPPQAGTAVPSSVGKTEGKLNLIAWEGYAQPQWVNPFEKATGCQVSVKYAGSSSEMVSLMAGGRRRPVRPGLGLG
jgi:putative spermidine/putrescine transport system substrate-binding protein